MTCVEAASRVHHFAQKALANSIHVPRSNLFARPTPLALSSLRRIVWPCAGHVESCDSVYSSLLSHLSQEHLLYRVGVSTSHAGHLTRATYGRRLFFAFVSLSSLRLLCCVFNGMCQE